MKNTGFMAAIVVIATSVTAAGALADSHGKSHGDGPGRGMHGKITFEMFDSDGNGEITLEEIQNRGKDRFVEIDTNQDGKLSVDELEAYEQKKIAERVAKMIERHDKDGDGLLVIEEMPGAGRAEMMFERFDVDGDGVITQEEFDEAKSKRKRHGKRHNKDN